MADCAFPRCLHPVLLRNPRILIVLLSVGSASAFLMFAALFSSTTVEAAGSSARTGDLSLSLEQCGKAKEPAVRIDHCSIVISRTSDRRILERAFNRRGLAYMDLKRFVEAAKDFTEVIRLNPRIAGYFDNRQYAYKESGRLADALNDANRAVQLAPTYTFVYRARANVFADMGRYDLAIDDDTKAISLNSKDSGLLVDRGKIFVRAGKLVEGIADFTRAHNTDPNMTSAYRERGLAYKLLGNFEEARSDLSLFLRLQPNDAEIVQALLDMTSSSKHVAPFSADVIVPPRNSSGSTVERLNALRQAETRVALVIGNGQYEHADKLANPVTDARNSSSRRAIFDDRRHALRTSTS